MTDITLNGALTYLSKMNKKQQNAAIKFFTEVAPIQKDIREAFITAVAYTVAADEHQIFRMGKDDD